MFDYSHHMRKLIGDIACRCPEFQHVDVRKTLVAVVRSRNNKKHGLQAKLYPLKFKNGQREIHRGRGRYYRLPEIRYDDNEILYLIYFCLPRFQNLPFKEKMATIFHEMYHINPSFNGDIRRFSGRFYQHSASEKEYDQIVENLADMYLSDSESHHHTRFLRFSHKELCEHYGEVKGMWFPMPQPIVFTRNKDRNIQAGEKP